MAVNKMFISALKRNDIDRAISLMICPGYDVNSIAYKDCTPLILSTKLGLVKVVQHLLSLGADTNWQDKNGRSALTHACISGNTEIIRELFKAGCNLNRPTVFGDRPIHEAVVYGRLEAVEVLLKAGVDINSKNSITKQTALQLAVLSEQKEVVDLLIQKNVAIDIPTFEGETALHYAVQVNDFRIVKSLIAAGASIHKKNQIGETPYLLAVQEGKIDHVKTLILAGCKMYSSSYLSPLSLACTNYNPTMVKYLLSEGYNASEDKSFRQHIYIKMEERHPELLDYVYNRCSNPCSLKEHCRIYIRRLLNNNMNEVVPGLALPKTLKEWILIDVIY
ncbi:ankyrin repeat domain-containing protein 6-like [Mytilus edulis]